MSNSQSPPESAASGCLPLEFVDAHHHFLNTACNSFQSFLASLNGSDAVYLPQDYQRDVVEPLRTAGIQLVASVHVECLPDDGYQEASWVESLANDKVSHGTVGAIVASCDLASPTAKQELMALRDHLQLVKGIRWILDYSGPFHAGDDTRTHVATTRHAKGMEDYLRGGLHGTVLPAFEQGFGLLEQFGFSFDLQCAPEQLLAAADLFKKYPNIPVVIDHMGKLRNVSWSGDAGLTMKQQEVEQWRRGLHAMAFLPNVYIKISMLGYALPNWSAGETLRESMLVELVQETIDMFGPDRCMVALNWWKDAATSDSDGLGSVGPSPFEFISFLAEKCFAKYSAEERVMLFAGTARKFYRLT